MKMLIVYHRYATLLVMKWILFFLLLPLLLWSQTRTQAHMGTLINITVEDQQSSDEVFDLFRDLDQRLSTHKSDSEISRLNQTYELNVSEITRNILVRSLDMNKISGGAFDVTVGSFTHSLYRFGYDDEKIPTNDMLQNVEQRIGSHRIKIDANHVKMLPGTLIDLGGIGKGYGVDLAIAILQQKKVSKAVIAASGDIGCLGKCSVEIQDPFHTEGVIGVIRSTNKRLAVSTSGNYERYIKNKSYNHLINPKTGKPQQRYASITLIDNEDNTRLDALATAVSIMDENKALAMLESLSIAYLLISNDKSILISQMPSGVTLEYK